MLKDKDIAGVAQPLKQQVDEWMVAGLPGPRGAQARHIEQVLTSIGIEGPIGSFDSPADAYRCAVSSAGQNDKILVFGSFFTVGAIMQARS
jgi:dihydrofolate synthase/folylpolyglutamate synthase